MNHNVYLEKIASSIEKQALEWGTVKDLGRSFGRVAVGAKNSAVSTLHTATGGGYADYIRRSTGSTDPLRYAASKGNFATLRAARKATAQTIGPMFPQPTASASETRKAYRDAIRKQINPSALRQAQTDARMKVGIGAVGLGLGAIGANKVYSQIRGPSQEDQNPYGYTYQ